jgi:glutamate synthase (NADPH/NADH) small chain
MELGEPDESGRRRPRIVEGSEHLLEADTVVIAIGQRPNPLITSNNPEISVDKYGYIQVNKETMATTKEGVYAGGDIAGWGANVIRAMGDGRKAARAIHQYVMAGEPAASVKPKRTSQAL